VIRDWLPVVALIATIKTLLTEERVQSRREEIANGISSGIGLHLSSGVLDGQSLRQVSAVQLLEATRLRHRDCLRNVLLKLKPWHLVETWINISY